ncbi:MAG TPA: MFS transporter [Bryobacteraceae bacterium]|nr:MFS transporter [Bryobacteraceae bacterium]
MNHPLLNLTPDGRLLFVTRFVRLFAYGALSVVLVFYLTALGLTEAQTGLLFTVTLAGDTLVSLFLTTRADRLGRKRTLIAGALLMAVAGLAFSYTGNLWVLMIAGTIGVISPGGGEVGPFLPIEQASLSHLIRGEERTAVFAWYSLAGSLAAAAGSLSAGALIQMLQSRAVSPFESERVVVILYGGMGILLALLFLRLSPAVEFEMASEKSFLGIAHSKRIVFKLSALFALDSFGGGFVVQSFAAYWFYLRFGVQPAMLGLIFFWANVFAGISALLASRLASRFGLVNTMVFTHLPSNVLLILVPFMPNLELAVCVLLLRFSISQMDVPARQSYIMAVVRPEERSATAGVTGVARTIGAAIAPWFAGLLFANPALIGVPFILAGTLKSVYDVLLYRQFIAVQPHDD